MSDKTQTAGDKAQAAQAPPPTPPVVPSFWVDSVETLRTFYIDRLGFDHMMGVVGKDGKLDHAIVTREDAMIMMGRPTERVEGTDRDYPTGRPMELYIYVKDVDAYHAQLVKGGVSIAEPLKTQWWGDRNFSVKDPYGYQLWFNQTVGELQLPDGMKMI